MNTLDKQYQELLQDILDNGVTKSDRTGTGTKSIFGYTIRHNMSEGFPVLTTKKMAWKTMVTELLWFLRGDTNIKFLVNNGCHIWDGDSYKAYEKWYDEVAVHSPFGEVPRMTKESFIKAIGLDDEFAKKWGDLGPVYGKQWRRWGRKNVTNYDLKDVKGSDQHKVIQAIENGEDVTKYGVKIEYQNNSIDQIQNLINDLKTNPDSRRLMVSAWNVGELHQMTLPPCHYGFQCYVREGKYLSLMWNQRSVDTPLGLPFNIASYALLLELLAMETDMIPDQLIGNLGDCHIYLNQIDGVKEQLTRIPMTPGQLTINDEFWNPDVGVFEQQDIRPEDFHVDGYESHPTIKFPLSN